MTKKSEQGNVIELVIIGVLVLGVVGLLVWRFVDSKKTTSTTNSANTSTQTPQVSEKTSDQPSATSSATQPTASNEGYLVLDDWGVRFKVISGFTVNYYKAPSTSGSDMYEFTTPKVEALSGCSGKYSGGRIVASLGDVVRTTEKYDLQVIASPPSALYGEKKIGNYYYYYDHPQALCSGTAADSKIESSQAETMQTFLLTLEPKQ